MNDYEILEKNVFGFKGDETKEDIDKLFIQLIKEYSFYDEIGIRK